MDVCSFLPSPGIFLYAFAGGLSGLFVCFVVSSAGLFGAAMFGWTTPDELTRTERMLQNKFEIGCFLFGGIIAGAAVGYLLSFFCR